VSSAYFSGISIVTLFALAMDNLTIFISPPLHGICRRQAKGLPAQKYFYILALYS
jgi:hypothetical protein